MIRQGDTIWYVDTNLNHYSVAEQARVIYLDNPISLIRHKNVYRKIPTEWLFETNKEAEDFAIKENEELKKYEKQN